MNLTWINTQSWFDSNQPRRELDLQSLKFSIGVDNSMLRWGGMQRFSDVIFSRIISLFTPLGSLNLYFRLFTLLVISLIYRTPPYREDSEMF